MEEEKEPFTGLKNFLKRFISTDTETFMSAKKVFVTYRAYIMRKKPGAIVSMDYARFCSYLDHLAELYSYQKRFIRSRHTAVYKIRFKSLKKLQNKKKPKPDEKLIAVPICDINANLCCKLCCGYLVNATTITECLHSFCKSCLVQYFQKNRKCPVCDILVHEMNPMAFIKQDWVLQDIVCKILPGLEKSERLRENKFFEDNPQFCNETKESSESLPKPSLPNGQIDFAGYRMIQLLLEWIGLKHCTVATKQLQERYIRVSDKATMGHIAQFVLQKLGYVDKDRQPTMECVIVSGEVVLPSILKLQSLVKHSFAVDYSTEWLNLHYDIRPLQKIMEDTDLSG